MIRRLHLEEVQPPVPTVAAASELNKAGDDDERRSLALEFKQLLSKVVGQVDPGSDEGTAMAMALAQAMPAQRISHQELQRAQDADNTQENTDQDLLDDEGDDREQLAVISDDNEAGQSSDQGAKSVGRDNDGADDSSQNGADKSTGELIAPLEATTDLTVSSGIVAENKNYISSQQFSELDADGPLNFVKSVDQTQEVASSASSLATAAGEVASLVEVQLAQHEDVRIKVQDVVGDDGDLDIPFETTATQVTAAGLGETEVARKVVSAQKTQENLDVSQSLNRPVVTDSQDQVSASVPTSRSELDPNGAAANLAEGVTRKRVEDSFKVDQDSKGLASAEPELISPSVSQTTRRGSEGVVQMAILRQAFESLRATRQESSEGQPKQSAPTVNGTAASAAPRRSEDSSSSKGSRAMSKGHMARMLERVQSTLTEAARARDGKTISLRLDPANLGRVKVDVSLKDGSLHARITPENQQVMTALREHAHELQGALRKLGLDVDSVTVTVRSDGFREEAAGGQKSFDGSTFQQDRNNMPHERAQLAENTIGNELAQWKEAVAPEQGVGVVDHWVA